MFTQCVHASIEIARASNCKTIRIEHIRAAVCILFPNEATELIQNGTDNAYRYVYNRLTPVCFNPCKNRIKQIITEFTPFIEPTPSNTMYQKRWSEGMIPTIILTESIVFLCVVWERCINSDNTI